MRQGVCLWFNWEKGYGFIEDVETKETFFVHYSGITPSKFKKNGNPKFRKLLEGEEVTFEVGTALNGKLCAINVQGSNAD